MEVAVFNHAFYEPAHNAGYHISTVRSCCSHWVQSFFALLLHGTTLPAFLRSFLRAGGVTQSCLERLRCGGICLWSPAGRLRSREGTMIAAGEVVVAHQLVMWLAMSLMLSACGAFPKKAPKENSGCVRYLKKKNKQKNQIRELERRGIFFLISFHSFLRDIFSLAV